MFIHGWSLEHINKQVYILQLMTALVTHYDYTWAVFLPDIWVSTSILNWTRTWTPNPEPKPLTLNPNQNPKP